MTGERMWHLAKDAAAGAGGWGASVRQFKILNELAAGSTGAEIARKLYKAETTVKSDLGALIRAWQAGTRLGVIGEGFRRGALVPRRCEPVVLEARSAEAIALASCGASLVEIGDYFGLSVVMVKLALRNAVTALDATGTAHAVALWMVHGTTSLAVPRPRPAEGSAPVALTDFQQRLLESIAAGLSPQDCAVKLVSPVTRVYWHRSVLVEKARTASGDDLGLVDWAYRHRILTPAGTGPTHLPADVAAVLTLVAAGRVVPQIARELGITEQKVWARLKTAGHELGARSRLGMVAAAYDAGVLEPETS